MYVEKLPKEAVLLHRIIYRDDTNLIKALFKVVRQNKFNWIGNGPFTEPGDYGLSSRKAGHIDVHFLPGNDKLLLHIVAGVLDATEYETHGDNNAMMRRLKIHDMVHETANELLEYFEKMKEEISLHLKKKGLENYIANLTVTLWESNCEVHVSATVNDAGMALAREADEAYRRDAVRAIPDEVRKWIAAPGSFIHEICSKAKLKRYRIKNSNDNCHQEFTIIENEEENLEEKLRTAERFFCYVIPRQYGEITFWRDSTRNETKVYIDYIGAAKDYAEGRFKNHE